ncbi:MAG: hypothetical protein OFPI_29390 [Osedax symbiont Rs2]|nr:MAG: hypothetical protein OFPI_29390 [Osedax symbiont Rs2]
MNYYALVGDIGGANARFALVTKDSVELHHVQVLSCADYDNFDAAYQHYYEKLGLEPLPVASISFACPVTEQINMTNNHWSFNIAAMTSQLGLTDFKVLNDFTAMAYGTLALQTTDKILVQRGSAVQHSPRLVIGPGTGLGVASLVPVTAADSSESTVDAKRWQAVATEGGHISFAPLDALQIQIWQILQQQYGRVSVERILCGDGILALYLAICKIKRSQVLLDSAADITAAANNSSNKEAVLTLQSFCQILGAVTGDMILAQGARGGVYLCGGILPRVQEFLLKSDFCAALANKGRLRDYNRSVPVWLCNSEYPGLLGAATALKMKSV